MKNLSNTQSDVAPFLMYFQEAEANPVSIEGRYDEILQTWIPTKNSQPSFPPTSRITNMPTNQATYNSMSFSPDNQPDVNHDNEAD
jgi:hypothetical protein